jgi:uncharacterized protein YndB with AHSA1/START domain
MSRPTDGAAPPGDAVVVERLIKAQPATVFSFFTDPARWLVWQGVDATVDPRPGGQLRVNVLGDGYASGRFTEIDPPHRLVFTWGWEMEANPVPPGSSTVTIELFPDPAGTLLRLTHSGLPVEAREIHDAGWRHFVERLHVAAAGGDPGRDPWRVD